MLSPRLQQLAELVPSCRRLIDVGTDHAYLPIALVESGRCREALAADLRPGPLARASQHIEQAGLADQIKTCLSDGLESIPLRFDDVVVIAGLGGLEMIRILGQVNWTKQIIILQPMKSAFELRRWLAAGPLVITSEKLAREKDRFYPLIRLETGSWQQPLSDLEAWLGPKLLADRPQHFGAYLARRRRQLQLACRGRPDLHPLMEQLDSFSRPLQQENSHE